MAMAKSNHNSVPTGFKEIPGYDRRYFINEEGHVWSAFKRGMMSPQTDATHPYPSVLLREGNRSQPRTLYYLMRLAWMPPAPGEVGNGRGKWCVNHKDGNKLNSHIGNLEWTTNEGNLRHAWENNLHTHGEDCSWAQFTGEQVREIRLRLLLNEKVKHLANEFSVSIQSIKRIQQYVAWKRQDWDLVEPMMEICKSKYLQVTMDCIENGGKFYDYSRPDGKQVVKKLEPDRKCIV
jgi:hypothetical protein